MTHPAPLPPGTYAAAGSATSRADRSKVFALLLDSSTWPRWSDFKTAELERPGTTEPYGVGAIRVLRTSVTATREEIVEVVPDVRVVYTMLSGLPLDGYRATVELVPLPDGGTRIDWGSTFRPRQAFLGWFWRSTMTALYGGITKKLAKAAEASP